MKIVHVYDGHEMIYGEDGSVPKVVWNLAKEAAKCGHQVTAIERSWKGLTEKETVSGVKFKRLNLSTGADAPWEIIPYQRLRSVRGSFSLLMDRANFALAAYRLLRQIDYDVIHVHLPFAANVLVSVFPGLRSKIVYTAHLGEVEDRVEKPVFSPDVYLANRVSRTVVLNEDMKQAFVGNGVDSKRVIAIPNGVDVERFQTDEGVGGKPVTILFVGTITPRKGVRELIESIAALPESVRTRVTVSLAGRTDLDKEYYERVKRLVSREGLGDDITFHGFVEEERLRSLYANADVLVLPSFEEGFGMVITEAMAARTAVIGSDIGGIPQQIQDGVNGFLVPPGDIDRLTEALREVVTSDERRVRFADSGVKVSNEFSWGSVYQMYEEVYRDVISG